MWERVTTTRPSHEPQNGRPQQEEDHGAKKVRTWGANRRSAAEPRTRSLGAGGQSRVRTSGRQAVQQVARAQDSCQNRAARKAATPLAHYTSSRKTKVGVAQNSRCLCRTMKAWLDQEGVNTSQGSHLNGATRRKGPVRTEQDLKEQVALTKEVHKSRYALSMAGAERS